MDQEPDYSRYATKMRQLVTDGTDMEVDARFVDMVCGRSARILDIGCGIGNAVNGLRSRGHAAYGIDPTPTVLDVARELYDPTWFRDAAADEISPERMSEIDLPHVYDVIFMAGNVPAFLTAVQLRECFIQISHLLDAGGTLIVGTTTAVRGGPADQDRAAQAMDMVLTSRFSDWHLGPFIADSPWSVSVFTKPGNRAATDSPDGIFILNS